MRSLFIFSLILLAGCSPTPSQPSGATSTVISIPLTFATATLVPTFTPRPSVTPAPPTIAPTISPVTAVLTSQVNVRTKPDQAATALGQINYGTNVQIIGRDPSSAWLQIIYPENTASTGWVSAAYVQVPAGEIDRIQVVQVGLNNDTGSPLALQETQQSPSIVFTPTIHTHIARVTKQMFVRAGPGQTFGTLGSLTSGTVVIILARNLNNIWIQIQFEGGVDGKAWVASAFLDGVDLSGLPYCDNDGNLIISGVTNVDPGQITPTATAYSPASADGDSEQKPAVRLKFSPETAREFSYSSDLSSPNGDSDDWVAFTPYEPTNQSTYIYFRLDCNGNGGVTATLQKDGTPVPEVKPILCGNYDVAIKVLGGAEYFLVMKADGSGGPLRYVKYALKVYSQR